MLKLLKALAPGDVVTVTRIDRLARSTFDLFAIVKQIVDAKAQFRSLAEPWADTATSTGRLMIAVLGGLADVERDLIRTRTAEGREPGEGARAAHGPTAEAHPAAAEGSTAAAGRRRDAQGTGEELQRRQGDDFEAIDVSDDRQFNLFVGLGVAAGVGVVIAFLVALMASKAGEIAAALATVIGGGFVLAAAVVAWKSVQDQIVFND